MKRYKITEEQLKKVLEELKEEDELSEPDIPITRDIPTDDIDEPLVVDPEEELTQEEIQKKKIEELTEKVDFLESFFRDIVDFQEFSTDGIDTAFKEVSEGKVGIPSVVTKLKLLTTRKGRTSFFVSKRGLV